MTARGLYNPAEAGAAARRNRFYPLRPEDLERFGPRGLWQAGTEQLRTAVKGLMVGEGALFEDVIASAARLLSAPDEQGMPWGDDPAISAARHRKAQALLHRLQGRDDPAVWHRAAAAYDTVLRECPADEKGWWAPPAALCRTMAGMPPAEEKPQAAETPEGAAILRVLAAEPVPGDIGRALIDAAADLFRVPPDLDQAVLLAFAVSRTGGLPDMETALFAPFVLDPGLSLPPALREKGWSDHSEALVTLSPDAFPRLARLLPCLGLARDGDAGDDAATPETASWTRQPDLLAEIDWHMAPDGTAYLDLRGALAGRFGPFLARALGGQVRPGPEAALTDLLTVPSRATPAHAASADARWTMICDTVVTPGLRDDMATRALLSAALRDSDWRIRMAALWGVGHHRISGLAPMAEAAALPKTGFPGLSQDDRRTLLALRDLAAARSAGLPDSGRPGANAGFVARIATLLDTVPEPGFAREAALVAALLQRPWTAEAGRRPPAWAAWMAKARGDAASAESGSFPHRDT